MVEGSDDGIILVDLQGRITDWNRGAERIYGYAVRSSLTRGGCSTCQRGSATG